MDQEEGGKGLSQPAPDWQSSLSDVRERNAVMLEKGLLADVYFIVGSGSTQRRIAAHKCMLVAGSSVFHAMFIGGLAEDKEVSITDVEPDAFINLLKWVDFWSIESFPKSAWLHGLRSTISLYTKTQVLFQYKGRLFGYRDFRYNIRRPWRLMNCTGESPCSILVDSDANIIWLARWS